MRAREITKNWIRTKCWKWCNQCTLIGTFRFQLHLLVFIDKYKTVAACFLWNLASGIVVWQIFIAKRFDDERKCSNTYIYIYWVTFFTDWGPTRGIIYLCSIERKKCLGLSYRIIHERVPDYEDKRFSFLCNTTSNWFPIGRSHLNNNIRVICVAKIST